MRGLVVGMVLGALLAGCGVLDGLDLGSVPSRASANADGQATDRGGAMALSGRTTLEPGEPSAQLATRAFPNGDALLRRLVSWRDASAS